MFLASNPFFGAFVVAALVVPGALYILPSILAVDRGQRVFVRIFLVNIFLGWTIVGWLVAMTWALIERGRDVDVL